jgi:hypothetical protein
MDRQGRVSRQQVVAAARDPTSHLHSKMTWDNDAAAEAFRLVEAGRLIRLVPIERITHRREFRLSIEFKRTPAFVKDPESSPGSGGGYRSTPHLAADADENLKREIIVAEFARTASALRRARTLAKFFDLEDEIDGLIAEVVGLRSRFDENDEDGPMTPAPS